MIAFLLVVHVMIALAMIGTILLQRSEGGALGIGGGGGGAGGLMSGRGVGNLLTRSTAFLAVAFFSTSILLSVLAGLDDTGGSVVDDEIVAPGALSLPLPAENTDAPEAINLPEAPQVPSEPSVPAEPSAPVPE